MSASPKSEWEHFGRANAAREWRKQSATMGRDVTALIVKAAGVNRGMHILDLACGTGEPAISLAGLLEGTGEVTGIDLSPESIKVAQERAGSHGLTNTRFQVGDAHELPFPDNTFDRVTSRLGVMFFADLQRALQEMRRVLKAQGRTTFITWGPMSQPYFDSTAGAVLRSLPGATLPPAAYKTFAFSVPGALTQALNAAGFHDVTEKLETVSWTWPGEPEQVWAYFQQVAVPFVPLFESIPANRRDEIDEAVVSAISKFYDGNEIKFTATVNLTTAAKT